jgi:murein DD-endopeptidase MepM/ murein hydrolase activator NlpD
MNGDEPRDSERSITDSFNNNRRSWAKSGHTRRERTDPASNGFSGHMPVRDDSDGPQVTTVGQDIGNFFKVLFAFFKGIWTQDFADFDLLSSVYFPPQPKSEVEVPAPQVTVPPPQTHLRQQEQKKTEEKQHPQQQTKHEDKTASSAPSGETGQKPSTSAKSGEETQQKLSPTQDFKGSSAPVEKSLSSTTQEKIGPEDQRSLIQKSVADMMAMRHDSNHTYWELPLSKLAEKLTQGIERPNNFDDMIKQILLIEGGDKINRKEPNGGISKYGINSVNNPGVDVENLTEKDAIKIIHEKYWQNIQWPTGDASKMSQAVQFLALDTAVNSPSYANQLLRDSYKKAGGDVRKMPEIMLEMREKRFESLAKENPKKFEGQLEGWKNRMNALRDLVKNYAMTVPTEELVAKLLILRPVDIKHFPASSDFGDREDPITGGHGHHHGTDYRTPAGTPLSAQMEGKVFKVATYNGYGKTLIVSHGDGLLFQVYAHLDKVLVKKDQPVHVGDKMALTGNTGRTTGPHLHHELWIREGNKFYVINEMDAISKNLNDPTVRKELIERAHMVEPALFKDAAFRKAALELQERNPTGADGPLVASVTDTGPALTTTR